MAENCQGPIKCVFLCLKLTRRELVFKEHGENTDHQAIRKQIIETSI